MAPSFNVLCNTMGQIMQTIKTGVIVFATDASRDGVIAARSWLKEKALAPDQVRLFNLDGQTLVETLRPTVIPRTL
jgi:hypothetical protein